VEEEEEEGEGRRSPKEGGHTLQGARTVPIFSEAFGRHGLTGPHISSKWLSSTAKRPLMYPLRLLLRDCCYEVL
jgi:hypothetical protein